MSSSFRAFVVFVTLAAIAGWSSKLNVITEAKERGYIIRCPTTGDLAWKGECDKALAAHKASESEIDHIQRQLEAAYMKGREDMARDIRNLLGAMKEGE